MLCQLVKDLKESHVGKILVTGQQQESVIWEENHFTKNAVQLAVPS